MWKYRIDLRFGILRYLTFIGLCSSNIDPKWMTINFMRLFFLDFFFLIILIFFHESYSRHLRLEITSTPKQTWSTFSAHANNHNRKNYKLWKNVLWSFVFSAINNFKDKTAPWIFVIKKKFVYKSASKPWLSRKISQLIWSSFCLDSVIMWHVWEWGWCWCWVND